MSNLNSQKTTDLTRNDDIVGDATQGCGGSSIVQLYNSTDLTPVTSGGSAGNGTNSTSTSAVAGGALGCYSDGVLYTAYTSPVMTNAGCVQQCYAEGYAYAATASGSTYLSLLRITFSTIPVGPLTRLSHAHCLSLFLQISVGAPIPNS